MKKEVSTWFSTCQDDFADPRCCPDAGQRQGAECCPSDLQPVVKSHERKKGESKLYTTPHRMGQIAMKFLKDRVPCRKMLGLMLYCRTFEKGETLRVVIRGSVLDHWKSLSGRLMFPTVAELSLPISERKIPPQMSSS